MVIFVVTSTGWPSLVAGRNRSAPPRGALLRRARGPDREPRPAPPPVRWPEGDAQDHIALDVQLPCFGRVLHRRLRKYFKTCRCRLQPLPVAPQPRPSAPSEFLPSLPCRRTSHWAIRCRPGMPAEATRPTTPAFEPDSEPLPMPVDPTTPCGATAGPFMPP